MKFLDLFAGIGGFRLGLEQAGHQCVGYVEWDKYARKSYEAIYNAEGEWTWHDITTIDYRDIPRADCWTFGFPCQDISVAGEQKGFDGDRSSQFFAVTKRLRQIKEWDTKKMPSYLLIENVKNFLSVNRGWDFLEAQIELDEVGYNLEWDVLNSRDFGVPQNRERVFIVGHLRGRSTRKVFPVRGTSSEVNSIEIIAHRKGYRRNTQVFNPNGITETLDTGQGGGRGHYTVSKVGNVNPSGNGMNGQVYNSEGLSPTLTTNKGEGPKIILKGSSVLNIKEATKQGLDTGCQKGVLTDEYRIRKLTPRECWRLQGFPDWAFDRATEVNSDSQLYKQAGNSVTVNVIEAIGKKLC
ncbi:DNA cytosine methyltransferase [Lysinibacillus capsici]|uniref:DNA cytosine methyltransferase n=1 Tax=Lysinibacillus capsici TaxID=2115968 RepID=UPI001C12351E|nr:DNA cytosine methyltransferase [Lysinibacillus capsici]MBU5253583.1 DNA cytosine methyltransferase [Lysinibacillus capsici]